MVPWPTMYETIKTRFLKKEPELNYFRQVISKTNIIMQTDNDYKENAWKEFMCFIPNSKVKERPSLVDLVIREIMLDQKLKIDYLVTYNPVDFMEICNKRNIILINE